MILFELHYAPLGSEEIETTEFIKFKDVVDYIKSKINNKPKVYLYCKGNGNHTNNKLTENMIIVTHNIDEIFMLMWWNEDFRRTGQTFLQEYESYTDAYEVALAMRENTGLAYNKQ